MNNQRMLIVDADSDHSRVLTRTFRQLGFDVSSVRNAESAMGVASSSRPGYVILEQQLESDSGLGLIRPLRRISPDAKILVLTRHASVQSAVSSIKLGAFNYMAKPAYIEEIMAALDIDPAATAPDTPHVQASNGKRGFDELEWKQIVAMLRAHDGNVTAAAVALGMFRRTLQRKLEARRLATGNDVLGEIRRMAPLRRRRALRANHGA